MVPSSVLDAAHGGSLGSEAGSGGAQLRRVRGVQHGGSVWGNGGEGGAVLLRGEHGGERPEGRAFPGGFRRSCEDLGAADAGEA